MEKLNNHEPPQLSVGQAVNKIQGIMGANIQTGRYDEEQSVFMGFIEEVKLGIKTPQEGVAAAEQYANGRQEGFSG